MAEVTQENGQQRALSVEELGQCFQALEHHYTTTPFGDTREATRKLRRYIADLENRQAPKSSEPSSEAEHLVKMVLDSGGEVLLPPAQWLLLARHADALARRPLPRPEDVTQYFQTLWFGMECGARDPNGEQRIALTRLCSRAEWAHVLEAEVLRLRELMAVLRKQSERVSTALELMGVSSLESLADDFTALRRRAESAESERDAALKREEAVSDHLQLMGVSSMESLAADFARLQRERASARQDAERLRANVAELDGKWREAMWQSLGRDPAKETGSMLIISRAATDLRARVASLESREKSLDLRVCAGEQNLSSAHRTVIYANENGARATAERDREKARAEAAERRVSELEDSLKATAELGASFVAKTREAADVIVRFRAPHHAPSGLLEAVERVLELAASPFNGGDTTWSNALHALRIAADAAKGGETLDRARVVEAVAEVHALCAAEGMGSGGRYINRKWRQRLEEFLGLTLGTPPSGPGGGEDPRGITITAPEGTPGFEPALERNPAPLPSTSEQRKDAGAKVENALKAIGNALVSRRLQMAYAKEALEALPLLTTSTSVTCDGCGLMAVGAAARCTTCRLLPEADVQALLDDGQKLRDAARPFVEVLRARLQKLNTQGIRGPRRGARWVSMPMLPEVECLALMDAVDGAPRPLGVPEKYSGPWQPPEGTPPLGTADGDFIAVRNALCRSDGAPDYNTAFQALLRLTFTGMELNAVQVRSKNRARLLRRYLDVDPDPVSAEGLLAVAEWVAEGAGAQAEGEPSSETWCADGHRWNTEDGELPADGSPAVCMRCPASAIQVHTVVLHDEEVEQSSPALAACRPAAAPHERMRQALTGAYLVLDEAEGEERARWETVLKGLEAALAEDQGATSGPWDRTFEQWRQLLKEQGYPVEMFTTRAADDRVMSGPAVEAKGETRG